jgi:transposase
MVMAKKSISNAFKENDTLAKKMFMLFEYYNNKLSPQELAKKYSISRAGFYLIKNAYENNGTNGLIAKKKGPKRNYVRTENIKNLVIRYKFIDSDCSPEIIAQKLKQLGHKISIRSVQRIISELRLQKKTLL